MSRSKRRTWTLADLAAESGIAPRTIRYYIARGLLNGPAVAGRGAFYDVSHLERLRKIQKLQAGGAMLAEIGRALAGEREARLPEPETWHRYSLAVDVVVAFRSGAAPWRARRILRALERFAEQIGGEE